MGADPTERWMVADGELRVLQLIKCLDRGGAEELVTAMVTAAGPSNCSYDVAFVRSDMHRLAGRIAAAVPVHDLGASSDLDLRWLVRLRRLLSRQRYDVLHLHLPYAAGLSRLVVRTLPRRRRPLVVYTEHSYWPRNGRLTRLLGRATSHLDDVSIAVSASTRAGLPAGMRRRTEVVMHGIDTTKLAEDASASTEVRRRLSIPDTHQVVVTVANLRPQKGYRTLLAAARSVISTGRPVTFLAAGHGPIEPELTAERDRLGLGDCFRFLGQRDDVAALVAAADVFVLASDWECMPVAVMEAFALGTPVVATAVGELPAVIDDGVNGLLVPHGDPERLAAAIERVLADESVRTTLAREGARTSEMFDVTRARRAVEGTYARELRR